MPCTASAWLLPIACPTSHVGLCVLEGGSLALHVSLVYTAERAHPNHIIAGLCRLVLHEPPYLQIEPSARRHRYLDLDTKRASVE